MRKIPFGITLFPPRSCLLPQYLLTQRGGNYFSPQYILYDWLKFPISRKQIPKLNVWKHFPFWCIRWKVFSKGRSDHVGCKCCMGIQLFFCICDFIKKCRFVTEKFTKINTSAGWICTLNRTSRCNEKRCRTKSLS